MASCSYCQIPSRAGSRIPEDIRHQCLAKRGSISNCHACQKFLDHERRIHDARRTLERLLDEREAMASVLNQRHDPFAHRFPVEIVSRIFLHCRPTPPSMHTTTWSFNEQEFIGATFTPGRVCQNWRKIARSTPDLWTTLCVTITESNSMASIERISEWLEQSGGLLLSIKLIVMDSTPGAASHFTKAAIASIVLHAQRWRVLDLRAPHTLLPWMSRALSSKSLDRLDHFTFDTTDRDNTSKLLSCNASPSHVDLHVAWLDQLSLSWQRLTHFSALFIGLDEVTQLFRLAPHLTNFKAGQLDFDVAAPPGVVTNAPKVETLHVAGFPAAFWDHLSFPSLKTLKLDGLTDPYEPLLECLRRSGCQVKNFFVNWDDDYQDELVQLLQAMPAVEHLALDNKTCHDPLFQILMGAVTQVETMQPMHGFLSQLRFLSCSTSEPLFNWSWLAVFLVAMKARPERLFRSFEFRYDGLTPVDSHDDDTDKESFETFMDATQCLDFKMINHKGEDLLKGLGR